MDHPPGHMENLSFRGELYFDRFRGIDGEPAFNQTPAETQLLHRRKSEAVEPRRQIHFHADEFASFICRGEHACDQPLGNSLLIRFLL